jgi:hypothetical protein
VVSDWLVFRETCEVETPAFCLIWVLQMVKFLLKKELVGLDVFRMRSMSKWLTGVAAQIESHAQTTDRVPGLNTSGISIPDGKAMPSTPAGFDNPDPALAAHLVPGLNGL